MYSDSRSDWFEPQGKRDPKSQEMFRTGRRVRVVHRLPHQPPSRNLLVPTGGLRGGDRRTHRPGYDHRGNHTRDFLPFWVIHRYATTPAPSAGHEFRFRIQPSVPWILLLGLSRTGRGSLVPFEVRTSSPRTLTSPPPVPRPEFDSVPTSVCSDFRPCR